MPSNTIRLQYDKIDRVDPSETPILAFSFNIKMILINCPALVVMFFPRIFQIYLFEDDWGAEFYFTLLYCTLLLTQKASHLRAIFHTIFHIKLSS